ncbi:MAG TPA: DinB family protein [Symbiobacteriaceae bacterium]|nr:DinB family protein [Symbiobacteriaceae bacterium]
MTRDRMDLLLKLKDFGWNQEGWFAPLAAALEGVTAAQASWQPPGGGNTIWQTVNHLNYYNGRLLRRFTGQPLEQGLPDNDSTFAVQEGAEAQWLAALEQTRHIADGLRGVLGEMTDQDLGKPFNDGTLQDTLVSWIMHDVYHTGQIVLLRKQQGSWPAQR